VPFGGTGLYNSVLAAVREVRSSYDPARVNSVVVLTDGKNEDAAGLDLEQLLRTLRAESDRRRPVPVIAIAYGPDTDTAALRQVASTTGGTVYVARDPRDLPLIFHEAIGNRLCGDAC
jgi:Mg-chelatase subunit ChlD